MEGIHKVLQLLIQQDENFRGSIVTLQQFLTKKEKLEEKMLKIQQAQNSALSATLLAVIEALVSTKQLQGEALLNRVERVLNPQGGTPCLVHQHWLQALKDLATGDPLTPEQRRSLLHLVPAPEDEAPPKVD